MNIGEVIRKTVDRIAPSVPSAWEAYIQDIRKGKEESVPVYGQGDRVIFDYYGTNKIKDVTQGRVRIPLSGDELEISYHITQTPDGAFHTVYEGVFPYAG